MLCPALLQPQAAAALPNLSPRSIDSAAKWRVRRRKTSLTTVTDAYSTRQSGICASLCARQKHETHYRYWPFETQPSSRNVALHSRSDFNRWIVDQNLSRHLLSQSNDPPNPRTLNFLPFSASRNLNRPYRRGIAESARTFARADSGTGDLHRGYPYPALCHLEHQSERNSGGDAGVEEKGQCAVDIPTASFRHDHRSTWFSGLGFRQTERNQIQAGRNAKPGIDPALHRTTYKA